MTSYENAKQSSFVLLPIGRRRFALPATEVVELAPPVRLHAFPHTSPMISGVIVRRGRVVPVYDVTPVLGGRPSSAQKFYLVARRPIGRVVTELCALAVNGECELATCEMQPPAEEHPEYVAGNLSIGGESLDVLNLPALVASRPAAANSSRPTEAQS